MIKTFESFNKNEIEKLKILYSTPKEAVDIAETLKKMGYDIYDFNNVERDAVYWEAFVYNDPSKKTTKSLV